jgi:hypothetical protein
LVRSAIIAVSIALHCSHLFETKRETFTYGSK